MNVSKKSKRILVVEDDKIIGRSILDALKTEGFSAELEGRGDRALKKILKRNYDLILLDLWLPAVNGFEILEALKQNKAAVPVIALSNSGNFVETEKLLKMGVKDCLIKARFTPLEVIAKIKALDSP